MFAKSSVPGYTEKESGVLGFWKSSVFDDVSKGLAAVA